MSPKSYTLQVESTVINISPFGFHRYSKEFLIAARAVPLGSGFSPVPYNLYCRSIELGLKAFLLAKGLKKQQLMKREVFRHDLFKGLDLAEKHGFGDFVEVTPIYKEEIKKANTFYDTKAFDYFDVTKAATGYSGLPNLLILDTLAASIIDSTESFCRSVA